jgi:subtilisin family serine protease
MPSTAFSNRTIRRRRLAGAIRSVLLAAAFAPGFGAASAGDVSSSAVSTDAPTTLARYTIVLRGDALATYRGGVAGYPAAPRIESGRKAGHLDVKAPASRAYVEYLAARQQAFVDALAAAIGRPLTPIATMQHALNAVIVEIDENEAAIARQRADVEIVERERMLDLLTDRGPAFIGAPSIWDGSASNGVASEGEGIVVADLDTGINWESPAFAATGPIDGYVHVNPNGAGNYLGLCGPTPPNADLGHCNDKLIGMYDFTSTSPTRSGADLAGHGSHTASTIVGNHWVAPFGGGTFTISGVAPHANIIAYRVARPAARRRPRRRRRTRPSSTARTCSTSRFRAVSRPGATRSRSRSAARSTPASSSRPRPATTARWRVPRTIPNPGSRPSPHRRRTTSSASAST